MQRYSWLEHEADPPRERFPEGVRGRLAWAALFEDVSYGWPQGLEYLGRAFDRFLEQIEAEPLPPPSTSCVFVSHRKDDLNNALHVAWVADQCGYDTWLDAWDLKLRAALGGPLPSPAQEILIAAIIEVALLNATHVVALYTRRSPGSLWIPYELGRAKARSIRSDQAAGWYYPAALAGSRAEYMHLVEATTSDGEIRSWLWRSRQPAPGETPCALQPEENRRWKPEDTPPPLDP